MSQSFHKIALSYLVLATLAAFAWQGSFAALSAGCGAGLMYLNFFFLYRLCEMIFSTEDTTQQIKGGILLFLKLFGLVAAAYIGVAYFKLDMLLFGLASTGMILTIAWISVKDQSNLAFSSKHKD